jgi:hypothetical protein
VQFVQSVATPFGRQLSTVPSVAIDWWAPDLRKGGMVMGVIVALISGLFPVIGLRPLFAPSLGARTRGFGATGQ